MLQIFIVKLAYIFQYVHYVKCKDEENVLLKRYLKINLIKDERDPPESLNSGGKPRGWPRFERGGKKEKAREDKSLSFSGE